MIILNRGPPLLTLNYLTGFMKLVFLNKTTPLGTQSLKPLNDFTQICQRNNPIPSHTWHFYMDMMFQCFFFPYNLPFIVFTVGLLLFMCDARNVNNISELPASKQNNWNCHPYSLFLFWPWKFSCCHDEMKFPFYLMCFGCNCFFFPSKWYINPLL